MQINREIEKLIDRLIVYWIDWQIDRYIVYLDLQIVRLVDKLIGRFVDKQIAGKIVEAKKSQIRFKGLKLFFLRQKKLYLNLIACKLH